MLDHSLQLTSISMTIFHLTDMNTTVIDRDDSILLTLDRNPLPDFLFEIQQKDFAFLRTEAERQLNQCCLFTNEWGLSYLSSLFEVEGEENMLLINGPFLQQIPDINKLYAQFNIHENKRIVLEEFFRGLKLISNSRIQSLANILHKVSFIHHVPLRTLDAHQGTSERYQESYIHSILQKPDEKYDELIELRYSLEKEITHAVERGDKLKAKEILSKGGNLFDFSDRFPNQPVRAMKNLLIILNTTLRIAAENGKVHPFFLHHISEKFSIQIERDESLNSLNNLITLMADEYCDLVRNRDTSHYSLLIQKAVDFLMIHTSNPLDLKNLAQYCHVHPAHLSRQFKKETGMTLTDFLHRLRIEEAKILLKKDRTPIDWIAGYVGFSDAGYFTRIFKRLVNVTPSEYRNSDSKRV